MISPLQLQTEEQVEEIIMQRNGNGNSPMCCLKNRFIILRSCCKNMRIVGECSLSGLLVGHERRVTVVRIYMIFAIVTTNVPKGINSTTWEGERPIYLSRVCLMVAPCPPGAPLPCCGQKKLASKNT